MQYFWILIYDNQPNQPGLFWVILADTLAETTNPDHKPRSSLLIKRNLNLSRFHLLEGNGFLAFQTNAVATFLAGSLGISPSSILVYNDMLAGWLAQ